MVCSSNHGADDCCWQVQFALWVHGNGLESLGHDLHVRMHPFQAPQCPADGLILGRFGKNAQDRNDALWCAAVAALFMDQMIGAGMCHLPCWCMAMDWQARGTSCMSGSIHFRPHDAQQVGWFWADLAKCEG